MVTRINVGCGRTPVSGWLNLDNSPSVRWAEWRRVFALLSWLGVVGEEQRLMAEAAVAHGIRWADGVRGLPLADHSVAVVYASHMFHHLHPSEARRFLVEALRVLIPGGVLRLVVPDLRRLAERYVADGDAETFLRTLDLSPRVPRAFRGRLRLLILGHRYRRWMYDAASLAALLRSVGFAEPREFPPGETQIADPGALNLREREGESIYIEARAA
jgi:SAM-dependent methyltransferase